MEQCKYATILPGYLKTIQRFPPADQLRFFWAISLYEIDDTEPDFANVDYTHPDFALSAAWESLKTSFDRRKRISQTNRANGLRGGAPYGNQNRRNSTEFNRIQPNQPEERRKKEEDKEEMKVALRLEDLV